ncbi:MAG: acetyl esterase [Pseudohongiellaceae bacterium]|jgi:acetyl esterase
MPILKSKNAERATKLDLIAAKVARGSARLKALSESTPEEARAVRESIGNPFAPPPAELASISDHRAKLDSGTIGIRVYRPKIEKAGLQSALIFYHGGGYVLSNVEQYDTVAQQLCFHSDCVVFSVDYRLAPEHNIKQIHEQGYQAYQWIRERADEFGIALDRIAMGGDSAGGNLTIAVVLACKRKGYPMPTFQLLIYPSVDLAMSFPSIDEFSDGYFLTKPNMSWFRGHYLENKRQANDPALNFLEHDLVGLPPAYLMTAGFDPLRDEGKAFVDKMVEQGVDVEHECYTDMIHGFISFAGGIGSGMECLKDMGLRLKKALS